MRRGGQFRPPPRPPAVTQREWVVVKWNGTNFVIVWQFRRENGDPVMFGPEFRVAAAEVTPEGRVLEPGGVDLATGLLYSVTAGFGRTVIVAKPIRADEQCVTSSILMLGDHLAIQAIPDPAPPCNRPRVSVNGDGFVTLWFQFAIVDPGTAGRDLWGQRFRATGDFIDAAPLMVAHALDLPNPTVTFGDSGGSSLIHVSDYNYSSMIRITPQLAVTRTELGAPIGREALTQIEALDNGHYALSWTSTLRILSTDDRAQENVVYMD